MLSYPWSSIIVKPFQFSQIERKKIEKNMEQHLIWVPNQKSIVILIKEKKTSKNETSRSVEMPCD